MRQYTYTRDQQLQYLRQSGWQVATMKNAPVIVAWQSNQSGKVYVKAWTGNAHKPAFYYSFSTAARAEEYVKYFTTRVETSERDRQSRVEERKEKRATLNAADFWTVGDVIYNSWGYDQTNIDWYQVVEVKAKSIVIRSIAGNSNDNGGPCGGRTAPRRNDFKGKPILKTLREDGSVRFEYGGASKWDGRAKSCSSYH